MLKKNPYSDNYRKEESNDNSVKNTKRAKITKPSTSNIRKSNTSSSKNIILIALVSIGVLLLIFAFYSQLQPSTQKWYYDGDGDGFGDANLEVKSKTQPQGYVSNNKDDNDADFCIPNSKNCKNALSEIPKLLNNYYREADNNNVSKQMDYFNFPTTKYFNRTNLSLQI